jgi:inhibitor of KinA sporulation pathway (predicted exonuclease)
LKNYFKYKREKIVVEDLIMRLGIEDWRQVFQEDNQLLFNDIWENLIKQLTMSHNKNQNKNLLVKGKYIAKRFSGKCFIYNKTRYQAKDCRNKSK